MDGLTSPQRRAVTDVLELLRNANVPPSTFANLFLQSIQNTAAEREDSNRIELQPSLAVQRASYKSPKAVYFTEQQCSLQAHRVTGRTYASALIDHPEGAIVEYPEAGNKNGESIAHRFTVDHRIELANPRLDIQYSLGDKHGGKDNVKCYLLQDSSTGEPVICQRRSYSCCSMKVCEFFGPVIGETIVQQPIDLQYYRSPWTADRELFTKTLALYTLLREHGCSFASDELGREDRDNSESDTASSASSDGRCEGRLILKKSSLGQYLIECEYRRKGHKSHLRLTDLHEYDLEYLSALLHHDTRKIEEKETHAKIAGYGPLVACKVMVPANAKKKNCSEWHRFPCGNLERGQLHRDWKCDVTFDVFVPNQITATTNQILIVCRNAHSHPPPAPTKTPRLYEEILKSMLVNLGWKLADATSRRILLDTGFIATLRSHLGWSYKRNPVLADLHPSFSNSDHVKRIILEVRDTHFPMGTDFKGVKALSEQNKSPENCYVRCAEEIEVGGKKIRIVICMTPIMSRYLLGAKRLTIDTSFKRVYKWEEFEIEIWHDEGKRSLVVCRAFTTSQSSDAHFELFKRIFSIAEADTGLSVRFRHIHGDGFETIVADNHKGQALGLGLFCHYVCEGRHQYCSDCGRLLSGLDPYEHLKHIFRSCTVHFKRHIYDMRKSLPPVIITAMLSLSTTEVIEDLEARFKLIRSGGKKAVAWLDDKLYSSKFAFPGVYWPASKIPLEIWKASPATTNGNEQAHRNVNRDGVGLTLLAGVMRGEHYDKCAFQGIEGVVETGVQMKDEIATHHNRKSRTISRKVKSQQRQLALVDERLKATHEKILKLRRSISTTGERYRQELLKRQSNGPACRKLKKLREQMKQARELADSLQAESSGYISLDFDELDGEGLYLQEEQVVEPHKEPLEWREEYGTKIYYNRPALEMDNSIVTNSSLRSLPHPPPASSTALFPYPIANTQPSMVPANTTNTTKHTFEFKEFVPDLNKWYG